MKARRIDTGRKRDTRIPRKPFLWLTAALLFTVPAMFGTLAVWVPISFLSVLLAKFWMEPRDYRLRSPIWKMLLGLVVLALVFASYGSIRGIEPGVSIVVIFTALKILEAHTARELQVLVNAGWILCLCGFFLSQDLMIAVCVLIGAVLLVVTLVEFHRAPSATSIWMPLWTAGKFALQAAPIMVLLFIFFPRVNLGVRLQIAGTRTAGAGFSGELSPGSVSNLANSSALAFRAEFPDGRIPTPESLYWRGVVMWQCHGMDWKAPAAPTVRRSNRHAPSGNPITQIITMEPNNTQYMFALDWPGDPPPGTIIAPERYLWSPQPIRSTRKYSVTSYPGISDRELQPREWRRYLEVPSNISPAVRQLAESWTQDGPTSAEVVRRGLTYLHTQGFRYSLSPGEYRENNLEEFLFNRRTGFCEHYAASFATLMRLAGIPARVVAGYLGGEYNEIGRFFVVRQSDSHAWCEVWLPEQGWKRVDPTSVVAPDRISLGLNDFLERRAVSVDGNNAAGLVRRIGRSSMFNNVRLAWQAVNYAWDTRVLSFDEAAQASFFSTIVNSRYDPRPIIIGALALTCTVLAIFFSWIRFRKRRRQDRLKIFYDRFCRKVASLGVTRSPVEGPSDFSMRAAQLLPQRAEQIQHICDAYIRLRYSSVADRLTHGQFTTAVKSF